MNVRARCASAQRCSPLIIEIAIVPARWPVRAGPVRLSVRALDVAARAFLFNVMPCQRICFPPYYSARSGPDNVLERGTTGMIGSIGYTYITCLQSFIIMGAVIETIDFDYTTPERKRI